MNPARLVGSSVIGHSQGVLPVLLIVPFRERGRLAGGYEDMRKTTSDHSGVHSKAKITSRLRIDIDDLLNIV